MSHPSKIAKGGAASLDFLSSARLSHWLNTLIHAEEIAGIVLLLDSRQPRQVPAERGLDYILTFHVESTRHPHRVLQSLRGTGVVRGVALNPGTPVTAVQPLLDELELILILSVNPGWGGQSFMPSSEARIASA